MNNGGASCGWGAGFQGWGRRSISGPGKRAVVAGKGGRSGILASAACQFGRQQECFSSEEPQGGERGAEKSEWVEVPVPAAWPCGPFHKADQAVAI